jgi:hypothetical protein
MNILNQRAQTESASCSPLKLTSFHKYDSAYADLTIVKKVIKKMVNGN